MSRLLCFFGLHRMLERQFDLEVIDGRIVYSNPRAVCTRGCGHTRPTDPPVIQHE